MFEPGLGEQMKSGLRERRRGVRRQMPIEKIRERSSAIADHVVADAEFERARVVLAFVSMTREVQTNEIVRAAWNAGKTVAAPRLVEDSMDLAVVRWESESGLERTAMGFQQPGEGAPAVADVDVDLVLVPALAIDERGHRLGYGKGYYDRLLPRLSQARRVGLIFEFERVLELPNHEHDVPVHRIATDAGFHEAIPSAEDG